MNAINKQHSTCKDGYREEMWVDFLLGNLTPMKRQQLERHLADCPACRQHAKQWGELLEGHGGEAQYAAQRAAGDEEAGLPDRLVLSLQRHVIKQARWHRLKRQISAHKYALGGAAAAILLIVLIFAQLAPSPAVHNQAYVDQYVRDYEPAAVSFVNAVDSAKYRIEAAEGQRGDGYIWLKGDLSEAFLWLDNLPQIGLNDYQVWAISGEHANSLGLVRLVGSRGHLYMNTPQLHPADSITLTVEPKGGSSIPTSKQIVFVVKMR